MVKLTPEERVKRLLHPMAVKMKERIDDILLLVTERGPAGIPKNRLEGELFLGGVGSIGTIRRHLKTLIELDRIVLYAGVYYTPENYQLRAIERVEDESAIQRALLRQREERMTRESQSLESHTHTMVGGLLSKESLPAIESISGDESI